MDSLLDVEAKAVDSDDDELVDCCPVELDELEKSVSPMPSMVKVYGLSASFDSTLTMAVLVPGESGSNVMMNDRIGGMFVPAGCWVTSKSAAPDPLNSTSGLPLNSISTSPSLRMSYCRSVVLTPTIASPKCVPLMSVGDESPDTTVSPGGVLSGVVIRMIG